MTTEQQVRASKFQPGDVVRLKSGGHKMTVEETHFNGQVVVRWVPVDWEGKPFAPTMQKETLSEHCLEKVK